MNPRKIPTLPAISVLTLIYLIAGKLSLHLAFVHKSASPVWPPAGIALAALLVLGFRVWPAIFVGAFLVNLTTVGNIFTSFGIASGNTLEAICGSQRLSVPQSLLRPASVVWPLPVSRNCPTTGQFG